MGNGKKKSKAAEYKEKMRAQEEAEAELAALPSKPLSKIIDKVDKVLFVAVPELECKLAYRRMYLEDFIELQKKGLDRMELVQEMLFIMLHAADQSVTREMVGKIPFEMAGDIINKITSQTGFLPATKS